MNRKVCPTSGFSLMELIVVVAILAVLGGVAIPYYQDYVTDARTAALKENMAGFRRALEEFKGVFHRGPFRGSVRNQNSGITYNCDFFSGNFNELATGVVPPANVAYTNRRNKLLSRFPILEDPMTGKQISIQITTGSLYFVDYAGGTPGVIDYDWDYCFKDLNGNGSYDGSGIDDPPVSGTFVVGVSPVGATMAGDVTEVYATDSREVRY